MMKKVQTFITVMLLSMPALVAWAQPQTMKMTTELPAGIATPDRLDTPIGVLNLVDGIPDEETTQKIYDNLDLQRGVQAYMNSLQIASLEGMRSAYLKEGPANSTVLYFPDLMDSRALWLTANTVSIYFAAWLETSDEPMVIETPPNVLGFIDNAWFEYVTDFGNAGPDKGKGGTFIILPPGYDQGKISALQQQLKDAWVLPSTTFGHWVVWRGTLVDGSSETAVRESKETFRIYPLSRRNQKPKMNFVNMSGVYHNTIHRMDYGIFEEINAVIQREPIEAGDPELLGMLAAIGIEKGQKFAPDKRMKTILEEAAKIGAVTLRTLSASPRYDSWYLYPGKRQWFNNFVGGDHEFAPNGSRMLDSRSVFFYYATGITPAMTVKMVGVGSQYAAAFKDADGNPFDGSRTYKINMPAPVPAKDFWSFTLYDNQTRSMLQTDQRFPGIDSNKKTLRKNADGSVDVYVGPRPPADMESNWIQSVPGKGWNVLLRLYGPLDPWFDKTWIPGDFELVE